MRDSQGPDCEIGRIVKFKLKLRCCKRETENKKEENKLVQTTLGAAERHSLEQVTQLDSVRAKIRERRACLISSPFKPNIPRTIRKLIIECVLFVSSKLYYAFKKR